MLANPSSIPVISSSYRLVSDQRASSKTVPPPRDRQPLGDKMGWCHGGLFLTISIASVPPPYCVEQTLSACRYKNFKKLRTKKLSHNVITCCQCSIKKSFQLYSVRLCGKKNRRIQISTIFQCSFRPTLTFSWKGIKLSSGSTWNSMLRWISAIIVTKFSGTFFRKINKLKVEFLQFFINLNPP